MIIFKEIEILIVLKFCRYFTIIALRASAYLSKTGKTTNEILFISRILRHIDNIGINLIACSYLLNKEMTLGMKKLHYKTFKHINRKFVYNSLKNDLY